MVRGLSGSELQAYEQDDAMTYGDRDTTPYYGEFQSYTAHYGRAISSAQGVEKIGAIFMTAISLVGDFLRGIGYILGGGDWKIQPSFFTRDVQPLPTSEHPVPVPSPGSDRKQRERSDDRRLLEILGEAAADHLADIRL